MSVTDNQNRKSIGVSESPDQGLSRFEQHVCMILKPLGFNIDVGASIVTSEVLSTRCLTITGPDKIIHRILVTIAHKKEYLEIAKGQFDSVNEMGVEGQIDALTLFDFELTARDFIAMGFSALRGSKKIVQDLFSFQIVNVSTPRIASLMATFLSDLSRDGGSDQNTVVNSVNSSVVIWLAMNGYVKLLTPEERQFILEGYPNLLNSGKDEG